MGLFIITYKGWVISLRWCFSICISDAWNSVTFATCFDIFCSRIVMGMLFSPFLSLIMWASVLVHQRKPFNNNPFSSLLSSNIHSLCNKVPHKKYPATPLQANTILTILLLLYHLFSNFIIVAIKRKKAQWTIIIWI